MRVAATVLNWNGSHLTEKATESLLGQVDRIYVIDNGSQRADFRRLERLQRIESVHVIPLGRNLGYSGGNNAGISQALAEGFDAIFVMNNDAIAEQGAVAALTRRLAMDPRLAAVAPVEIEFDGGRVLHTACEIDWATGRTNLIDRGRELGELGDAPIPTGYVSGAAFLARAEAFRECGTFDERFFCYFEDTEWSVRVLRAGWRLEVVPTAVVRHRVNASTVSELAAYYTARNRALFLRIALGKRRTSAFALTLRPTAILIASLLRRHKLEAAFRGVKGWTTGLLMRT